MQIEPIQFDRAIPLFPLPNCVLFPGTVQPLHIFEPRYRAMTRDAVAGPGIIAMALLKPGWESRYYAAPPVHTRVCAGRVIAHEQLPDGKYNLLLQGVTRADLRCESMQEADVAVYRTATLKPVGDMAADVEDERMQRQVLRQMFEQTALRDLTVTPALWALLEEQEAHASDLPHAARLIDALAFSLVQDVAAKQRILEEDNMSRRGEILMRELMALAARLGPPAVRRWPPAMSMN